MKTKSTLKAEIIFTKEIKEKLDITFKLRKKISKPSVSPCSKLVTILMSCVTVREIIRKSDMSAVLKARKIQVLYMKLEVLGG